MIAEESTETARACFIGVNTVEDERLNVAADDVCIGDEITMR